MDRRRGLADVEHVVDHHHALAGTEGVEHLAGMLEDHLSRILADPRVARE